MRKLLIFGNSSSGKSTLAKRLARQEGMAHFDLDTVAWLPSSPPERAAIADSKKLIDEFIAKNISWVVEGCYTDLLELVTRRADEMIFLDLPTELCVVNAKRRPWEPHKYKTQAEQDANLDMLIAWIRAYEDRDDTFSRSAHQQLYTSFAGNKHRVTSND